MKLFSLLMVRNRHCRSFLIAVAACSTLQAFAATFTLESTTVILDEREGQVAFNVKNDGDKPLLLVSRLADLDGGNAAGRILISPPITRIDPGQSQQVNYSLKKGPPLDREVMLKASFEGVTEKTSDSVMVIPIRQEVGFLIQPAAVPKISAPWQELELSADGQEIVLENPGKHVIRLSKTVTLLPGGQTVTLDHAFVMPGEEQRIRVSEQPDSINVIPLSRYGFVLQPVTLRVKPKSNQASS